MRRWPLALVLGLAGCSGATTRTSPPATPTTAARAPAPTTAATTTTPTTSTTSPPPAHALDATAAQAALDAWREQVHAFGASAGVRVPGLPDLLLASGVDDRDPDTPMRTDGPFFIASVTKTFVGAVVLQLADQGVLSLDDPVERWLPGVVPNGGEITLRMLMSHTSGLADFQNDEVQSFTALVTADLARFFTPAEAIAYSTKLPPVAKPGEVYHYANAGFQVLGEVAAAAGGAPIAELVRTRLLQPLGLAETVYDEGALLPGELHSWFSLDPSVGDPNTGTFDATVPRDLDIYDFPRTALMSFSGAAGAMRSTLPDLLAWGDALYGGRVLSAASTALLTDVPEGTARRADRYGLGVIGFAPKGPLATAAPAFVGHDGDTVGNRTLLVRAPSGVVIAIHANVAEVALGDLVALASELLGLSKT
jgi:D-alanyl-D-alanine carboxypeptidase